MTDRIPQMRTVLAWIALSCVLITSAAATQTMVIVLERLNGTYTNLGGGVREVRNGLVVVRPTSQSNLFELHANRLELTPLGNDEHLAVFWVRFEGKADVEAEILVGGLSGGTLTDEVTVPNQERTIESRIKLERREDDYLITVVESPRDFSVTVQSRLGGQIVSVCESLTRLTFGSSCDGLDAALSNPRIPMPGPGEEFVLDSGELTPEERARFDQYLAASD